MSSGLRELRDEDLRQELERMLAPRLADHLLARDPGHCARATDVDADLAVPLCRRLRSVVGDRAQIHILGDPATSPPDVTVTGTKLVELRNPDAEGRLRPPLLVFVPPGTHASAEDSFGVATFEQLDLGDVYADLTGRLLDELPAEVRTGIEDVFAELDAGAWPYADSLSRARFLLTVKLNESDPAAAGAALFELGLVPDFELLAVPHLVRTRVARNLAQMRVLTDPTRPERGRVLALGITDAAFHARLAEFAVEAGLENPREWTRRIVIDRNWHLAFHRWPLGEEAALEEVRVEVTEVGLPRAGDRPEDSDDPILRDFMGQLYLPAKGLPQFSVSFRVSPDPREIAGLAKFSVQLISEDSGMTGVAATVRVGVAKKQVYKATFKKRHTAGLEAGWHFVRVVPLDAEGIPLPVESHPHGVIPLNESDRFFVVPEGTIDDPPERRVRKDVGVTHALRRLAFEALADGREWRDIQCHSVAWKGTQRAGQHTLEAVVKGQGTVEIPLAPILADLERALLADPGQPIRLRLSQRGGLPPAPQAEPLPFPDPAAEQVTGFLAARRAALAAIAGSAGMVVEGCDLTGVRDLVREYAEAYRKLLAWQSLRAERAEADRLPTVLRELTGLLQIDTVAVDLNGPAGEHRELVLISPTHPLRLLWLVVWSELGMRWLSAAAGQDRGVAVATADTLLEGLTPSGFPLVVPRADGRLMIASAELTPYWGVCVPTETEDPQSLLGALAAALRVPERAPATGGVSGRRLADRVERYLLLHPYVTTLTVNVVNAGPADHLADMLVELQRRKNLRHICYDVRLFTGDPEAPGTGDALAALLRGEWSTGVDAEVFATPTAPGTRPKLAVAVRPLREFLSAGSPHPAHLTLLFDAFGGEAFEAGPGERLPVPPVHGLIQDVSVVYDEETVTWRKQPRHWEPDPLHPEGPPGGLADAEELTDLLATLPAAVSAAAATVATGQTGLGMVPHITLALDVEDRALLHQAHRSSDWVITVDRTLGVEYFDSVGRTSDYVIDFDPERAGSLGHHMVVSSRSVEELRSLIAPAVAQHGLDVEARHVGTFFDQLRLLSGRLALKLASAAATQRTEVLGLALARLYLDYQGALADQIVVPLDAHLDLYREARKQGDLIGDVVGLQRTDLALFELDRSRRTITCRLVEVKSNSALDDLSFYQKLKERMAVQLERSQTILAEHFDPHRTSPDRPDRKVQNARLAALLRFYLERALRHGVMRPDAAAEAHRLLDELDLGYRLHFTRTGLIFDLSGRGSTIEHEGGIEFHRVGRDLATELLDAIPTEPALSAARRTATLATVQLSLPRLRDAAFLAPGRPHESPVDRVPVTSPSVRPVAEEAEAVADSPAEDGALHDAENAAPAVVASGMAVPETPAEEAVAPETTEPEPSGAAEAIVPDVLLGSVKPSPQYGILGEVAGRIVGLDLNETHTISLFGVQGGGKSYTLGTIMEMACLPASPVNRLPHPLATIVFHYSQTQDYAPEFTSMVAPNDDAQQIEVLAERYGARPRALDDVVMLVPEDQLAERASEYPRIDVRPLKFGSGELRAEHWRFLMGAVGNQSTYIRQLQRIMRVNRNNLTLDVIRNGIAESALPDHLKQLAEQRLELAAVYIDDSARIKDLVRPGRMIIVDLRDEFIEKDEALGLFVVLMQLFAEAQGEEGRFNKLVVFDEAHKYIESPDLVAGLVESVREMRHKGMSVLVASQDPPSVPISLIELSNHVILHKFTSPAWLKHLQKANASLSELTPGKMAALSAGEAYVWSSKATDTAFTRSAVKIRCRPRITRHGGGTKTAVT